MQTSHLINSIYRATEGEGVFLGRPQIFVRYQGCHVGCLNCDSKDTWEFDKQTATTLEEIIRKVFIEGHDGMIKNVSITGGDPLHPTHVPQVLSLCQKLKSEGYYVNIEAAGTRVVEDIFNIVDYISFDFKTPSTGVRTPIANIRKMINLFPHKFQLKAVIADERDFLATLDVFKELAVTEKKLDFPWVLTPCYNTEEAFPMNRFTDVLRWNEENGGFFRVIGQQHKWIWGPDQKQV